MEEQTALISLDHFNFNLILIIIIIPTLIFLISKHKNFQPWKKSQPLPFPPGPKPWPIVGNLLQIGQNPHITFTNFAKTHGPIISLKLGSQTVVVATSPLAAAEILRTHDSLLSARHLLKITRLENINLSLMWAPLCGQRWRALRALCRAELLSSKAVDSQSLVRRRKVAEMVEFVARRDGRVVELRKVVSVAVFNILTSVLFSRDMVEFEGVERGDYGLMRLVDELIEIGNRPNLADYFPLIDVITFNRRGFYRDCLQCSHRVYAAWEGIVEERREGLVRGIDRNEGRDFLDAMLERGFQNDQINRLTIELLTAGIDTTSTTIEWAMTELIRNKKVMERLKQELIAINFDPNSKDSESTLSELPYLNACFKETLRLHPPAPFLLPHSAPQSCELMGYTIPKNSLVLVNVWAIGRDPNIWDEPLVFKPERFLGLDLDLKGSDFKFIPFGAGRRICPGMAMGCKQVVWILANLIHCFDWCLPNGQSYQDLDISEKLGIALQKKQPLLLVPKIKF